MWRIKNKDNLYYTGYSWSEDPAKAKYYNKIKLNRELKRFIKKEIEVIVV